MKRILYLFSSPLERDAAFPEGLPHWLPDGALVDVSGVGPIDAAIGAARAVAAHRPDAVVYLGTCGAHRGAEIAIGDVVVASTIRLGSGDVARGEMRIPSILPKSVECDTALGSALAARLALPRTAPVARVSCTLGVTENDALARLLAEHDGSEVENLEAFSVAHAAAPVPAAVLLGVTNIVGAGGGSDWLANYRAMMSILANAVVAPSELALEPDPHPDTTR
jgi:nucleoside phosphorylase